MGGFSEGGGVRVNCLLGIKTGAGVILSLLTGFFPFLLLVGAEGAEGAMITLLGRGVVVRENFSAPPRAWEDRVAVGILR